MSDQLPARETAEPASEPELVFGPPCRHLRNKGMYIYTDGSQDNAHPEYDNTIYWCLQTMKSFGPDDSLVGGEDCHDTGRSCYEPI